MTTEYILLKNEIVDELFNLERIVTKVIKSFNHYENSELDRDVYIDSVAINLHSFYSGVEKTLESIANKVDHYLPSGSSWHKELLTQMNTPIDNVRPVVVSSKLKQDLQTFLDFRHVVRNLYTYNFDPDKVRLLVLTIEDVFDRLKNELADFEAFLNAVGMQT